MSLENVKYDAFISYRHCELDSFISENLHKRLENYKMPGSVIKKLDPKKTRIDRVFRDEAELPLSSNLSDPITEALDNSEFLIVICTPRLPQSQWCKKEIETFVETHDREHVLLVLAEGEPEESFPDILMHEEVKVKDENGNDVTVRVDREPLAADCRGDNNRERLKAMDNVVLKLCAAIFNLNYDDLKQRHRERQIRRRLAIMSLALMIVTVFAVTCLVFMLKISSQNRVISDKYAGAMASASEKLLSQGLRLDSIYAVRNVLPDDPEKGYNKDAYNALVSGIAPYEIENSYFPTGSFRIPKDIRGFSISDDGRYALINCDGYFSVTDIGSETGICHINTGYSDQAVIDPSGVVYIDDDMHVRRLDPVTGDDMVLSDQGFYLSYVKGKGLTLVFSDNGIAGYRGSEEVFFIDFAASMDPDNMIDDPDYSVENIYISKDSDHAAFVLSGLSDSWTGVVDISEGKLKKCFKREAMDSMIAATDGEMLYVCYEKEDDLFGNAGNSVVEAADLNNGREYSCDIPGTGFYEMTVSDNGILIVSDRLAYVIESSLEIRSTITGYMDAVCCFDCGEGYVIVDALGRMFSDNVFSDANRTYGLYGHDDNAIISNAIYSDDSFFVKYVDVNRIVKYSPMEPVYEAMNDIGDADPFTGYPDEEVNTDLLEGIEDISVFYAAASDDGKYIAVSSNDGVLYIFDAVSKKMLKEIYNTDIVLLHGAFPYIEAAEAYILEKRVFDKDFNIISRLPNGELAAVGRDKKSVVLRSVYSSDTYYKIDLLSYDEMLKKADGLLGDYVPDKDICEKYQLLTEK